jgi:DNA-binding response OmpR family regulator
MFSIQVISEDKELENNIKQDLEQAGYKVVKEDIFTRGRTDFAIVDLSYPLTGKKEFIFQEIVKTGVPYLLIVPENGSVPFESIQKAVDFLMLPYNGHELLARVKLVEARGVSSSFGGGVRIGDLLINPDTYEVTAGGNYVNLTYKEYELLKFLASQPGRVFTRQQLLHQVWGYDYIGGTRTVDVHIRRLRAKLGKYESMIETVRNVGYRLQIKKK